jgi:hypothetical protein
MERRREVGICFCYNKKGHRVSDCQLALVKPPSRVEELRRVKKAGIAKVQVKVPEISSSGEKNTDKESGKE